MSKPTKRNVAPIDWTRVGRRIRELRGFDLTQKEFAAGIGVSQSYLSSMENGTVEVCRYPTSSCSAMGEILEWLLTGH
jgi:transcriptional regulator with XRE-family HTH domain